VPLAVLGGLQNDRFSDSLWCRAHHGTHSVPTHVVCPCLVPSLANEIRDIHCRLLLGCHQGNGDLSSKQIGCKMSQQIQTLGASTTRMEAASSPAICLPELRRKSRHFWALLLFVCFGPSCNWHGLGGCFAFGHSQPFRTDPTVSLAAAELQDVRRKPPRDY